jgi:hypothetical protein
MRLIGHITDTHLSGTGYPFPTDEQRAFDAREVVAFAKSSVYGDYHTSFYVKLVDGSLLYVSAVKQEKGAEKWLRRIAKGVGTRSVSRDVGWALFWRDVTEADAPTEAEENAGPRAPVKHRPIICDCCGKDLGVSDMKRRDVFRAHWPYCPSNPERRGGGKRRHAGSASSQARELRSLMRR